jgi:hypothetical protein
VHKRKGPWFAKLRQQLLCAVPDSQTTGKGRLLYVDPESKEVKGVIPLDAGTEVVVVDRSHFDVEVAGRAYHFATLDGGKAEDWAAEIEMRKPAESNAEKSRRQSYDLGPVSTPGTPPPGKWPWRPRQTRWLARRV